jgi:hypothetical protein
MLAIPGQIDHVTGVISGGSENVDDVDVRVLLEHLVVVEVVGDVMLFGCRVRSLFLDIGDCHELGLDTIGGQRP